MSARRFLRPGKAVVGWLAFVMVAVLLWSSTIGPQFFWQWLSDAPWYAKPVVALVGYLYFGMSMFYATIAVLVPYVLIESIVQAVTRWWRTRG